MKTRRTTVTAPADALATLEREALSRGLPLTAVLAEAVEEKAKALRGGRRPHIGVARSQDGQSAAEVASNPIARPPT